MESASGSPKLDQLAIEAKNTPDNPEVHANLARELLSCDRAGEAAGCMTEALKIDAQNPEYWYQLGIILEAVKESKGAGQSFAKAMELKPDYSAPFFKLMEGLAAIRQFGKLMERLEATHRSIKREPLWTYIACLAMLEMGNINGIKELYNKRPKHFKNHITTATLRIRSMVYDPDVDGVQLLAATQDWDRWFSPQKTTRLKILDPDPDRQLRIGFVMSRMRNHNLGVQLHSLIKHHQSNAKIMVFASNDVNDSVTKSTRNIVDAYHDISQMSDQDAAKLIRQQKVDILIDINEFTNDGRLALFTLRVAPVQIHYLGNAQSTGLRAMDYRISDELTDPLASRVSESSEKVKTLSTGYHLYDPQPEHADLKFVTPAIKNEYVTFGAIHHLAKYNDDLLDCIREIMLALPNARLILARMNFEDAIIVEEFSERLRQRGLPMERVELRGDNGTIGSLVVWQDIDCVLDSFPFSGDSTTLDSLYAGVPIVTLSGDRIASRRTAGLLHQLNITELTTRTKEDYVKLAVELGKSPERLNEYRKTLHRKFTSSPICNHGNTAKEFFQAVREIWIEKVSS